MNEQIEEIRRAFIIDAITFTQAVDRLVAIGLDRDEAHRTVVNWTLNGPRES